MVDRDEALDSGLSWAIYKSKQCEKNIDATREMHANWMRYVNCARYNDEQNLVAFQYHNEILYPSCRPITPGHELLLSYKENYAKDLGITFNYIYKVKCSVNNNVHNVL
ncbi:zinc finger protein 347-like [Tachysurus ichikawai]